MSYKRAIVRLSISDQEIRIKQLLHYKTKTHSPISGLPSPLQGEGQRTIHPPISSQPPAERAAFPLGQRGMDVSNWLKEGPTAHRLQNILPAPDCWREGKFLENKISQNDLSRPGSALLQSLGPLHQQRAPPPRHAGAWSRQVR